MILFSLLRVFDTLIEILLKRLSYLFCYPEGKEERIDVINIHTSSFSDIQVVSHGIYETLTT